MNKTTYTYTYLEYRILLSGIMNYETHYETFYDNRDELQ